MSVTDQLKEIVDGVARSGALTPEAIRQFDDLRKQTMGLQESLDTRTKERDEAKKRGDEYSLQLAQTKSQLEAMTKRAQDAEAKVLQAEKAIWIAEFEKQRREEMRSIVGDIFRNSEVRRTISHSQPMVIPPTYPGGISSVQYSMDTKEETETTK